MHRLRSREGRLTTPFLRFGVAMLREAAGGREPRETSFVSVPSAMSACLGVCAKESTWFFGRAS